MTILARNVDKLEKAVDEIRSNLKNAEQKVNFFKGTFQSCLLHMRYNYNRYARPSSISIS